MTKDDLGVRLYAASVNVSPEDIEAEMIRYPTHERIPVIARLGAAAEATIAERIAAARRVAQRECYNAVCALWMDEGTRLDRGISLARDAIGKLIDGENDDV